MQTVFAASCFARDKAGKSRAARMARMATTTNSSMKVNPKVATRGVFRVARAVRAAKIEFVFIGFGYSGDERQICRVTGPRRFPPPNHATGFEIIWGLGISFPSPRANKDVAAQQLSGNRRSEE